MKWLIYLLLLINISLFAWHYRGAAPAPPQVAADPDLTRLVLVREQQARSEADQPWCYSLGPAKEPEQIQALKKQLQQWQYSPWQRKSQEAGRKGYWVLMPPLASRSAARQMVTELKSRKIKDYFLIATGEKANGISLGVFSTFEAAHRRINQLKELGFEAQWEEVRLPVDEYWLDWPREAGGLAGEQLAQLRKTHPGLQQVERRCQPPTTADES